MNGLLEKVVIVTGGAGGIGREICARFARAGSTVAIFDLNHEAASVVARNIVASLAGMTGRGANR